MTTLVVLVVVAISATTWRRWCASASRRRTRGQMLRPSHLPARQEVVAPAATDPCEALRNDGGVRSILESEHGYSPTSPTSRSSTRTAWRSRTDIPRRKGSRCPTRKTLGPVIDMAVSQLEAVYSDKTYEVRQARLAGDESSARSGSESPPFSIKERVQDRPQHGARHHRRCPAARDVRRRHALTVDAAADPRDPERTDAPRTRGTGRDARILETGVPRSGQLVRSGERAVVRVGRTRDRSGGRQLAAATDLESVMENLEDAVAFFSPRAK